MGRNEIGPTRHNEPNPHVSQQDFFAPDRAKVFSTMHQILSYLQHISYMRIATNPNDQRMIPQGQAAELEQPGLGWGAPKSKANSSLGASRSRHRQKRSALEPSITDPEQQSRGTARNKIGKKK